MRAVFLVICDVLLLHLLSFQIGFTHPSENETFILDSDDSLYGGPAFDDISSGESGTSGNEEDEGSGSGQQPLGHTGFIFVFCMGSSGHVLLCTTMYSTNIPRFFCRFCQFLSYGIQNIAFIFLEEKRPFGFERGFFEGLKFGPFL